MTDVKGIGIEKIPDNSRGHKGIAYIIALPAIIAIFIFKVIPIFNSLIISFKDYKVFAGIGNSPWVGSLNYSTFFQSPFAGNLMRNAFAMNFVSIVLTSTMAFLLILIICNLSNKWIKTAAVWILAIPAFIPIAPYIMVFFNTFSVQGVINGILNNFGKENILFFAMPGYYWSLYAMMDSLRNLFIPVIIGVLACGYQGEGQNVSANSSHNLERAGLVILTYVLVRITSVLSPNLEILLLTNNPLVYEKGDVVDTYTYRTGLINMQSSVASAGWIIKSSVQFVINIGVFFLLSQILKKLKLADAIRTEKPSGKYSSGNNLGISIMSIVGFIIMASGAIYMVISLITGVKRDPQEDMKLGEAVISVFQDYAFVQSILVTITYSLIGCVLFAIFTLLLAYPLMFRSGFYSVFLIFILSYSNNIIGEYMFFKNLGWINTLYPPIVGTSMSIFSVFALKFAIAQKNGQLTVKSQKGMGFNAYLRVAIMPLIVIAALNFIASWGGFLYQQIYTTSAHVQGVGLLGSTMLMSQHAVNKTPAVIVSAYALVISILPIIIGSLLIWLNKIFPLSAFSVQGNANT